MRALGYAACNLTKAFAMKRLAALAACLVITACSTPQEQCISRAAAEYRGLMSKIRTAQENVNRGYAIHRQTVPYTVPDICTDREGKRYRCPRTEYRTEETPVPINIREERRKVATYKARLPAARRAADAGAAQCRVAYPED